MILAFLCCLSFLANYILCDKGGNHYDIDPIGNFCSFCLNSNSYEVPLFLLLTFMAIHYFFFVPSITINLIDKPPIF